MGVKKEPFLLCWTRMWDFQDLIESLPLVWWVSWSVFWRWKQQTFVWFDNDVMVVCDSQSKASLMWAIPNAETYETQSIFYPLLAYDWLCYKKKDEKEEGLQKISGIDATIFWIERD